MSAEDVTFQAAAAAVKEEEDAKPLEDGELSDDDEPSSAVAAVALEEGEIPAASSSGVENADKSNEKVNQRFIYVLLPQHCSHQPPSIRNTVEPHLMCLQVALPCVTSHLLRLLPIHMKYSQFYK